MHRLSRDSESKKVRIQAENETGLGVVGEAQYFDSETLARKFCEDNGIILAPTVYSYGVNAMERYKQWLTKR